MSTIKTVIVDDERLARVTLARLLESYPEIEIVGEADSYSNALEVINQNNPDLVFLDIQLGGKTGFEILADTKNTFKTIFVTAFDEYAIRAFEVNAVDYLLKPINPERLKLTIDRVCINKKDNIQETKKYDYTDSIYIKLNNQTSTFIKISSIVYIEAVGNYTKIVSNENKSYIILKILKQWEEQLPTGFFKRIHRSIIINVEYISKIEKYSKSYSKVYLLNVKEPLEISRRFASRLRK